MLRVMIRALDTRKNNKTMFSVFSMLFMLFALGELRGLDRISYKEKKFVIFKDSREILNEPSAAWSSRNNGAIVFIEEADRKNVSDQSNNTPNNNPNVNIYGVNPQIQPSDTFNNKRGNSTGYDTSSNLYEKNNNGPGKDNSWAQSTTNENSFSPNIEYVVNQNKSGSSQWGNNPGGQPEKKKNSEFNNKRRLLPETSCGVDIPRRIIGGTTADIDEFPWLALLQYRDRTGKISHVCGGSLISSRYVLTAAHCAVGLGVITRKLKLEKVRLGEWDLLTENDCQQDVCNRNLQDIEIEEIISHPDYKARQTSQTNDIALLRLRREAKMNQFVQPICLPLDNIANINFEGKKASVAGWGKTSNMRNSNSNIKMKVDIPVVAWDSCRSFYESFYNDVKIMETQMCAGGEEGKDSCQGDSGGPLMSIENIQPDFRWFVIGVVSSGPAACGVEGRPSLYTKVSDFTDWILDNIRE